MRKRRPMKFNPTKKICPECGSEFTQERWTQKYCRACGEKHKSFTRANSREQRVKRWLAKHNPRAVCQACGTPVNRMSLYCKACENGRNSAQQQHGPRHARTCPICGREFETSTKAGKFCPRCKAIPELIEAHRLYTRLALRDVDYPPARIIADIEFRRHRDEFFRRWHSERAQDSDSERTQS